MTKKSESVAVKRFVQDMRVLVLKDEDDQDVNRHGTVTRICTDGMRAWVTLDSKGGGGGDEKARTYPENCQASDTANRAERRAAARKADEPTPTLESFGRDHWSTFAYIEHVCVDRKGVPEIRRMRCDRKRHPLHAHLPDGVGGDCPTRLKDGVLLHDHDDWDCIADLEAAGLLENIGTNVNPVFRMTTEGNRVASLLRVYKQNGGNFATFSPSWTPPKDHEHPLHQGGDVG
jgi:hypothetical protein